MAKDDKLLLTVWIYPLALILIIYISTAVLMHWFPFQSALPQEQKNISEMSCQELKEEYSKFRAQYIKDEYLFEYIDRCGGSKND